MTGGAPFLLETPGAATYIRSARASGPLMPKDEALLRLSDDVAFEWLSDSGQAVVVSLASGQLYTCNETTYRLLRSIDGVRTFGQIVGHLGAEYEVAEERLRADLSAMADELIKERLVFGPEDSAVGSA